MRATEDVELWAVRDGEVARPAGLWDSSISIYWKGQESRSGAECHPAERECPSHVLFLSHLSLGTTVPRQTDTGIPNAGRQQKVPSSTVLLSSFSRPGPTERAASSRIESSKPFSYGAMRASGPETLPTLDRKAHQGFKYQNWATPSTICWGTQGMPASAVLRRAVTFVETPSLMLENWALDGRRAGRDEQPLHDSQPRLHGPLARELSGAPPIRRGQSPRTSWTAS